MKSLLSLLTICLLSIIPFQASSQANTDSLKQIWEDESATDSIRLDAYHFIIKSILFVNPTEAFPMIQEELKMSIESEVPEASVRAYNKFGVFYIITGNNDSSVISFKKGLKINMELGDQAEVAGSWNNLGLVYSQQGNLPKAADAYTHSILINEELENEEGLSEGYNNLATLYYEMHDFDKAYRYNTLGYNLAVKTNNKRSQISALGNLSIIQRNLGNSDTAKIIARKVLQLTQETTHVVARVKTLANIASEFYGEGNLDSARHYLKLAEIIYDTLEEPSVVMFNNTYSAVELKSGNIDKAIAHAKKAVSISEAAQLPTYLEGSYKNLAQAYEQNGNTAMALKYIKKYIHVTDSLRESRDVKKFTRMELEFEFATEKIADSLALAKKLEEEEERILLAQVEQDRSNRLQYSGIVILGLFLITLIALSGKLKITDKTAEGLIFIFFILLFEFILVIADPFVDEWSGGLVGIKLAINSSFALILFFGHQFFETKLKKVILQQGV